MNTRNNGAWKARSTHIAISAQLCPQIWLDLLPLFPRSPIGACVHPDESIHDIVNCRRKQGQQNIVEDAGLVPLGLMTKTKFFIGEQAPPMPPEGLRGKSSPGDNRSALTKGFARIIAAVPATIWAYCFSNPINSWTANCSRQRKKGIAFPSHSERRSGLLRC